MVNIKIISASIPTCYTDRSTVAYTICKVICRMYIEYVISVTHLRHIAKLSMQIS